MGANSFAIETIRMCQSLDVSVKTLAGFVSGTIEPEQHHVCQTDTPANTHTS